MATKIEEVEQAIGDMQKAVEPIITYCNEFKASYTKRMEPLEGDAINTLTHDLRRVEMLKRDTDTISRKARNIASNVRALTFK